MTADRDQEAEKKRRRAPAVTGAAGRRTKAAKIAETPAGPEAPEAKAPAPAKVKAKAAANGKKTATGAAKARAGGGTKRPAKAPDKAAAKPGASTAESQAKTPETTSIASLLAAEPKAPAPRPFIVADAKPEPAPATPASPARGGDFDVLAENMAQLVDQGRKALAAAIGDVDAGGPRSELAANVADATKTLGVVAEIRLAKPSARRSRRRSSTAA